MKVFVTRRSFIPVCRGAVLQHAVSHQRAASYNTNSSSSDGDLRHVMRLLPQPVTVVTSAMSDSTYGSVKRGVTCSSFTSVTMEPPTISVSVYSGNIINAVIRDCNLFGVNILSDQQLKVGMHFAKGLSSDLSYNQFDSCDHTEDMEGIPVIAGCLSMLLCRVSRMDVIGDHHVWFGEVMRMSASSAAANPMLYFQKRFHSIGDEIFMKAFEDVTLPFEEWTHEAHLRMAWNYITEYESDRAASLIRQGIRKLNAKNQSEITRGYSETVTMFYFHTIAKAVSHMPKGHSFEEFLCCHSYLTDPKYLLGFYSVELLSREESKKTFVEPDKACLP